jgi:hypothetical protein
LDLRQSVLSGLPILAEPLPTYSLPSSSHRQTPHGTSHASCGEKFQSFFVSVLPMAQEVAQAARSVDCSYETAVNLDKEVREILREVGELSAKSDYAPPAYQDDTLVLQWEGVYLDILFRRLLLELHRRFAYEPQAAVQYSVSHWSTLDCAAAMLVLQRSIYENSESTAGQWLIGIFRSDFFVAGLTISVYLLQNSSQLGSPILPGGSALETLLQTLRSCRDIWGRGKAFWLCEFQKFQFFDQVIASLDQGTMRSHSSSSL